MEIESLFTELGVDYRLTGHHCRPGWIQVDCPRCGPGSGKFHLGFNLTSHHFNCWKCGWIHPHEFFRALDIPPKQIEGVLRKLKSETGPVEPAKKRLGLREPAGRGPLLKAHKKYLRERGFEPAEIERLWGIAGIGLSSRLSWRIYIPITNRVGTRVSWTTRAIGDRVEQRYISASAGEEAVNHKSLLYGAHYCRHSIVIVEGPTDAWAVGPGAGATFGTAFSAAQVRVALHFPHRFICFDSTPEAQRTADRLADELSCFPGQTYNIVLDADDPGSASKRELRALKRFAKLS